MHSFHSGRQGLTHIHLLVDFAPPADVRVARVDDRLMEFHECLFAQETPMPSLLQQPDKYLRALLIRGFPFDFVAALALFVLHPTTKPPAHNVPSAD